MKNEKNFRRFLNLFQYGDENTKKRECIEYIVSRMNDASAEGKPLQFDRLANIDLVPNPCVNRKGDLFIDTRKLWQMYDEWKKKVRFVETEVAEYVREDYLILDDVARNPFKGNDGEK